MRTLAALVGLALSIAPAWTQCRKLTEINSTTPEGQLLQKAGLEEDPAKKLELQEQFVTQFPQHEAAGWVYEQLLAGYLKTGQPDKALAAGEKLNSMPPECVENPPVPAHAGRRGRHRLQTLAAHDEARPAIAVRAARGPCGDGVAGDQQTGKTTLGTIDSGR